MAIETPRLLLRPWRLEDLEPFAQLNADPRVMEYFPATLSREESDQLAKRIEGKIAERGWGFWAVSLRDTDTFIGFIGLNSIDHASFPTPFTPCVEIGWRLAFANWGKGYAPEGAKAALAYGFETLQLPEIVAFTAKHNQRSQAVMRKIDMHSDPKDDFLHPKIPDGHPIKPHVLYRLTQKEWLVKQKQLNPTLA